MIASPRLPLTRARAVSMLRSLRLGAGQIVFVHSSLSAMGRVEGGANTVVDGLLEVLGPEGTLVVPAFTPSHRSTESVFDPATDASEVGQITEVVRNRPGAFRSRHLRESMAALGRVAEEMMRVHSAAAWAADGPFWKLYEWDARILLLGVPYLRSTFWHLIEQMVQPVYGRWRDYEAWVRESDGTVRPLPTRGFGPKTGYATDFNKLGSRLEAAGLVNVGAMGNAIARLYRARDAFDFGVAEFRKDPELFLKTTDGLTELRDGVIVGEYNNEKSVVDSALVYSR